MCDAGLDVPEEYVLAGNYMPESGVAAVQALWRDAQRPDAIIAANAKVARGVLDELVNLGCRIPEDVAVSAIDDPFPDSKFGPRLTVVEQPGYEMGKKAVELLLSRLPPVSSTEPAREVVFDSVLRPGATCGEMVAAAAMAEHLSGR
jgi:DNA-binding LacI/PurR family transcriptional regulator